MRVIQDMMDRMRVAKTLTEMDGIINEWVDSRDQLMAELEVGPSWHWGKAIDFKFSGHPTMDLSLVNAHVQFEKASRHLRHWITELGDPIKETVLIAVQGGQSKGARHVNFETYMRHSNRLQ